jgi:hypothetical protein
MESIDLAMEFHIEPIAAKTQDLHRMRGLFGRAEMSYCQKAPEFSSSLEGTAWRKESLDKFVVSS